MKRGKARLVRCMSGKMLSYRLPPRNILAMRELVGSGKMLQGCVIVEYGFGLQRYGFFLR